MTDEQVVFNGINGSRGSYLFDPLPPAGLARMAQGELPDPTHLKELEHRRRQSTAQHLGVKDGVDPEDLAEAGWGVIFAHGADPAIREALQELLDFRREQATRKREQRYKEYTDVDAYRPDETHRAFLARHGAGPGAADPDKVPYYLLIVGDPKQIPYRFQYQLDVQYAVGRIHFDTLDEYAQYARSVVAAERDGLALPRRAAFFGVANQGDRATEMSADQLIKPLRAELDQDERFGNWSTQTILAGEATKARLSRLLGGEETPALLFTASHGMGFDLDDSRLPAHQGALLCQDWPGQRAWGDRPIPQDFYLAADDIGDDARLWGMIAFHFACYGAGTPQLDDFAHLKLASTREVIAPHAFLAQLPRRLLSHPRGGALAVIGHVDRAWSVSFSWPRVGANIVTFGDTLKLLMGGSRVGRALEAFNERYAELATDLNLELEDIKFGKQVDALALADMWTANNDSRSYVIIGDPAVRLAYSDATAAGADRPALEPVRLRPAGAPAAVPTPAPAVGTPPPAPGAPAAETPIAVTLSPQPMSATPAGRAEPVAMSGGTTLAGTVVFVHGTGTREPGYGASLKQVADGVRQALPGADLEVVPCYWGGTHGAKLPSPSGSIPREQARDFAPRADDDEVDIALWGLLYQDPLYELRVLAAGAPQQPAAGTPDLGPPLASRVQAATAAPPVRELAREAGVDGVLDEAGRLVTASTPYREALRAPAQGMQTYTTAVARAIVAQAIALSEQRQIPARIIFDAQQRDALVALLLSEIAANAASFSLGSWITGSLQELAQSTATWYVQRNRDALTDAVYPFAGDIVLYQGNGAPIREFILRTIEQARPPVVLLAHSLGGIVCVDLLALTRVPQVKLLITVGSQAPFVYEINALQSLRYGAPLPEHFPPWLNIYDRRDFLSYVGGEVFPGRVRDVMVDNRQPFARSHTAYWANQATWEAVARAIGTGL